MKDNLLIKASLVIHANFTIVNGRYLLKKSLSTLLAIVIVNFSLEDRKLIVTYTI